MRQLTDNDSHDFNPAWSPDGAWIAFVSDRAGGYGDLYVMDTDGEGQRRLTFDEVGIDWLAWSPVVEPIPNTE